MIKVIAFDFAGVIVEPPLRTFFDQHNLDRTVYKTITKRWDIGEINLEEAFALLSEVTKLPKEQIYDEVFRNAILKTDVIELIQQLKKHYKIALFSNNISALVQKMLQDKNIVHLFDEIFISSDYKMIKPNADYYQKMLDVLNVQPHEVVFIDDAAENVETGNQLGIHSILFEEEKKLDKELQDLGIITL